jgi:hypothetical protein
MNNCNETNSKEYKVYLVPEKLLINHKTKTMEKTLGVIRHVLTFVGGILVSQGLLSEGLTSEIIGGIITIAGTVWSIVAKFKK